MKKNFRNFIDLNPHAGDSFLGLTRQQAKTLAMVFIISAMVLASPPGIPDGSDLINIALAKYMVQIFPALTTLIALILTYTIMPIGLFLIGAYIYPYSTNGIISGYLNRIRRFLRKYGKDPIVVIIAIIIMYQVVKWYATLI